MVKEKDKTSTKWTAAAEALLVETLIKQKLTGNWGDNNPKPVAWTACENALAGSEEASGGCPKTVVAIKSRWQRVRASCNIFPSDS
jgi:hypothetical protein